MEFTFIPTVLITGFAILMAVSITVHGLYVLIRE